jgi:hypothetical protein
MKSGSWSSYQSALPPEARAGGEPDDEPHVGDTRDLWRLAQHNPTVRGILTAWQVGRFATFEAALIALAVVLADHNEQLKSEITKAAQNKA